MRTGGIHGGDVEHPGDMDGMVEVRLRFRLRRRQDAPDRDKTIGTTDDDVARGEPRHTRADCRGRFGFKHGRVKLD